MEGGKRQMQKAVATGTQNKRFIHTTISKTKTSLTNPLSRIQVGKAQTPPQEIFAEFVGKRKFIFLPKEHNGRSSYYSILNIDLLYICLFANIFQVRSPQHIENAYANPFWRASI